MMNENIRSGVSSPQLDGLDEMLATATRRRAEAARQVEIFDKHIDNLKRDIAKRDRVEFSANIPPVKPLEYEGMRAVDALEAYLKARRGVRVQLSQAVRDLEAGGVDRGRSRGNRTSREGPVAHTLRITLPNKPQMFDWTPQEVSKTGRTIIKKKVPLDQVWVWLAADADKPKRRARKKG